MGAKGGKQTVGWKYYLGLHMIMCHGPADEVQSISMGEREAWLGSRLGSGSIVINNPNLFGGNAREGGVVGTVDAAMGEITQIQNDYLLAQLGPTIPAFRGVVGLIFRQVHIGSNNPYVKSLAVRIKRLKKGWSGDICWNETSVDINGAMNPTHIIYECLTNPNWGMGYPTTSIDDTQFRATALKLKNEGFGLCMMWNSQAKIEEFIGDVVDHIGALLRVNPSTGLFQLVLIRADYNVMTLETFDESNTVNVTGYQRPSWGETTNEITVVYTDMNSGTKRTTSVQDLANIAVQGGVVSASREYPGIVNPTIAGRVALRDLQSASLPLAKMTLTLNRKAIKTGLGDVIRFSWQAYGIVDMPLRILNLAQGTLQEGTVTVEAVEDIFGLPLTTWVVPQSINFVDTSSPPVNVTVYKLMELSYWELYTSLPAADFNAIVDNLSAFFCVIAQSPAIGMYGLSISPREADFTYSSVDQTGEFCPRALAGNALGYTETTVLFSNATLISEVLVGTYGYIDDECIVVTAIDTVNFILTIKRGMMDTVPATHNSGAVIWFAQGFLIASDTEFVAGAAMPFKLLTDSAYGIQPYTSGVNVSLTSVGRVGKPYPPARVRLNTLEYPNSTSATLTVTWAHRDRTSQTLSTLIDQYQGSIGPEVGTTYNIRYYNHTTSVLITSATGLTVLTHTPTLPVGSYFLRIELESVVSTRVSMQKHQIITFITTPAQTRITEAGDRRITEDLNVRVTE